MSCLISGSSCVHTIARRSNVVPTKPLLSRGARLWAASLGKSLLKSLMDISTPRRLIYSGFRASDQVPVEQAREAKWVIKSLLSNPTRQNGLPSPYRAPHEAEQTTKSCVNLTGIRDGPTQCCCPASVGQDTSSPNHVRASRTVTKGPCRTTTVHHHKVCRASPH